MWFLYNDGTLRQLIDLLFFLGLSEYFPFAEGSYILQFLILFSKSGLYSLPSPETLFENRSRDGVPSEDLVTGSMIELCVAHHQLSSYFCSSPSVAHTAGLLSSGWLHFCCCCSCGSSHGTGISKMRGSSAATTVSLVSYPGLSPCESSPATQCLAHMTPSHL